MGKVVRTIALIAVLVAVAVFVPTLVPGALAAVGVTAASATVITLVSTLAVMALSTVALMLLGPKPPKLNQPMMDRLTMTINPATPRKFVFGTTAAGADVRFQEKQSYGSDKNPSTLWQVVALASHRIQAVKEIYLEDELSSVGGNSSVGKFANGVAFGTTLEGQTANASVFGSGAYWTTTASFTGCAYLKIRTTMDFQKIFPDGLPTRITTIVDGCPVFDPRLSSAVGGSGSMSPTNNSTWAFYDGTKPIGRNPALCLLTYILGWKINGKLVWGLGIPPERISFANFITYANICEQQVAMKGGGTVNRYYCDGIFDTSIPHDGVTGAICAAMGTAKLVDTGGLYQIVGGYNDTNGPILSFTDTDLFGSYEWRPAPPSRDTFNIATGKFASPDDLYVLKDWGRIELDPLADGIPRTQTMDFACVSRPEQCQRIAKQRLLRNKKMGSFTALFGPRAFGLQVGSLLYLSLPAEGWNNKLFRVMDQTESAELLFSMVLQEEDAAVYAWDMNETQELPPSISIPGYDPSEVVPVTNLNASARQVTNSGGGKESFIDVTWDVPSELATDIQVQTKEASGDTWSNATTALEAAAGEFTFRAPAGGLSTDIRARFRMYSGALGPWATATINAAAGGAFSSLTGYLTDEEVTFAADENGNIL